MPEDEADISKPPTLRADNIRAVKAHHALRPFRQHDFAPDGFKEPRRIQYDDIERYAAKFGPHGQDGFALFIRQIGVMEDVYMAVAAEQLATARRNARRSDG